VAVPTGTVDMHWTVRHFNGLPGAVVSGGGALVATVDRVTVPGAYGDARNSARLSGRLPVTVSTCGLISASSPDAIER
jgi:hypothetical protein